MVVRKSSVLFAMAVAITLVGLAPAAHALPELKIDINKVKASAFALTSGTAGAGGETYGATPTGAFSSTFSGKVEFVHNPANPSEVTIIPEFDVASATQTISSLSGVIYFNSGVIAGGGLTFTASGKTYSHVVVDETGGSSAISGPFSSGFNINGNVTLASVPGPTWYSRDVSNWSPPFVTTVDGAFINFFFDPISGATAGVDTSTDIDIFLISPFETRVPLPMAGLLGGLTGLGFFGMARRNRVA